MIWPGEKYAWDRLKSLESKDVTTRTGAIFDPAGSAYKLACLGQEILVSLKDREISGSSPLGKLLTDEMGEYSRLSILGYLLHGKELPFSGRLIKPSDLPGGDFFLKGSHILPLDKIINRFENNFEKFINLGKALGGSQAEYGDVALRLWPFQRIPVVVILWAGDEAFQSQASLLFDSSCASHMATDILWSTAVMTIEMMARRNQSYPPTRLPLP